MKMEKEKWFENVMNATAEFKKLEPSADLDNKVFAAIASDSPAMVVNFNQVKYGIAAAIALIVLNVAVLAGFNQQETKDVPTYLQSYNLDIY